MSLAGELFEMPLSPLLLTALSRQQTMRRLKALRTCRGTGHVEYLRGDTFWLHKLAARASVARGESEYFDEGTETAVAVSPKDEDTSPPLPKKWQLDQMTKTELLSLLDRHNPGHSITIRHMKAEILSALIGE